jgi:two-component system NarL family sensor kinase
MRQLIIFLSLIFISSGYNSYSQITNKHEIDSLIDRAETLKKNSASIATIVTVSAISNARKINYLNGELRAYILLSEIEVDSGKYETALSFLNMVGRRSIRADSSIYALSLQKIGNIETRRANYQNAISIYMHGLEIAEKIKSEKIISDIYNNIGSCYLEMRNYEQALNYHQKALIIREQQGWKEQIAASLQNIGNVYLAQIKDSIALPYFQQSLAIRRAIGDRSGEATTLNCIASVHVDMEENLEAKNLMLQALAIRKEIGEIHNQPQLYGNLADVSTMLGDNTSALKYLDSALTIAKITGSKRDIRNIYESYSYTYDEMKDAANSLKYYKMYAAYKDSIFNEKNLLQINDLQAKYESSQKENRIKLQQAEISKQKNRAIYLSLSFILIVIIGALLFNRHRLKANQVLQEEKIMQERLRIQSMIMAQEKERRHIAGELHDGLGQILSAARLNLESYSGRQASVNNNLETALSLIDNSFTELRNISHQMMPVQLIRYGLGDAINSMVEDLNRNKTIAFHFENNDNFPRLDTTIEINIYRIVQEWVNNIIKYSGASEVSIQLILENNELSLMIEDNGTGFDVSMLDKGKGNGWYNINSRLNLIEGQLEIDSRLEQGTVLSVYIMINSNQILSDAKDQVVSS